MHPLDAMRYFPLSEDRSPEGIAEWRAKTEELERKVDSYIEKTRTIKPTLTYTEYDVIVKAFLEGRDIITEPGGLTHFLATSDLSEDQYLRHKITFEKAVIKYMGEGSVAFGYQNRAWKLLLLRMQPGDELWECSTCAISWTHLHGHASVALVRNGEIVYEVPTRMN